MPKITKGQESEVSQNSRISGGTSVGGAQSLAKTAEKAGKTIEALGQGYLQVAQQSIEDTIYSGAISKATLEFNELYNERINQKVDKNGNPTYLNLDKDVKDIAKSIEERYTGFILNKNTRSKFNRAFTDLKINKFLQANGEMRSQHLNHAKATLSQSIDGIFKSMDQDNGNNLGLYVAQGEEIISDAVLNGVLDPLAAEELRQRITNKSEAVSEDIITNSLQQGLINKDISTAEQILNSTAKDLGVSRDTYTSLFKMAKSTIKSAEDEAEADLVETLEIRIGEDAEYADKFLKASHDELGIEFKDKKRLDEIVKTIKNDQASKVKKEQSLVKQRIKSEQSANAEQIEFGLLQGTLGEADVLKQANDALGYDEVLKGVDASNILEDDLKQKKISQSQVNSLIRTARSQKQDTDTGIEIDKAAIDGQDLEALFSSEQINKRLDQYAEAVSQKKDKEYPDIFDRLEAAVTYGVPSKKLSKEMKNNLEFGKEEDVVRTIDIYNRLKKYHPKQLEGLSNKDLIFMNEINRATLYEGKTIETAIESARNNIYVPEEEILQTKIAEFRSLKQFNTYNNLKETFEDTFGISKKWSNGYLFTKASDTTTLDVFKDTVRSMFIEAKRADIDSIIDAAKTRMSERFQPSTVNQIPGIVNDKESWMFLPPEITNSRLFQVKGGDTAGKLIRSDLEGSFSQFLPQGVKPDRILIESDSVTAVAHQQRIEHVQRTGSYKDAPRVSWKVMYLDEAGKPIYLTDENNKQRRFFIDSSIIEEKEKLIEKETLDEVKVEMDPSFVGF